MRAATRLTALILAACAALASCELFGGSTQVRFRNSTAAVTFTTIQFDELQDTSPLAPGQVTSYSSVPPGQAVLRAQMQGGTWTTDVQLAVTAGHDYTITLSDGSPGPVVSITADN